MDTESTRFACTIARAMVHPDYQKLTPEAAQDRGQKHYLKNEYSSALEAFSAAFELSGRKSISILDNRAATYEKLARWTAAYRDASLMVSLRPDDPRVLRLTANKVPQALAVPKGKLLDPFQVLPAELSFMVAELFGFKTLVLCLRVSKSWNRLLSSLTPLWRNLDLSVAQRAVGQKFIVSCIRRSKGTLTRALLQRLTNNSVGFKAILLHIAMKCKNLKHLEIPDTGPIGGIIDVISMAQNLNTLILHPVMRFEASSILLKNCPNLVHVEFHKLQCFSRHQDPWPNNLERIRKLYLRRHWIHGESTMPVSILQRLLDRTLNLRELILVDWGDVLDVVSNDYSRMSQLESLSIANCHLGGFPLLPPTIRHLTICSDRGLLTNSPTVLANLRANDLSQLESLVLREIFNIKLIDILSMLREGSSLKLLHISRCLEVSRADLLRMLTCAATKHVVDLALVDMLEIDDDLVKAILDMEHLESLDLSGNLALDGVGVKRLIGESGAGLKKLGLNGCRNVGRDAVDWARHMGIVVDFEMEDWELRKRQR